MSVIKTSTKAAVEILAFHKDVAAIAIAGLRSQETMAKKMAALVTSRYGTTCPTFEQHRADIKALDAIAVERKLANGQWVRRPYNAAIVSLFKALPVSQAPDAVAKREQREKAQAQVKAALSAAGNAAAPVGAPVGETQERTPSPAEKMEQVIVSMGVYETLYACIRILESDESTKAQAVHLRKMADKAHDTAQAADKAARTKAITPTAPVVA